MESAKSLFVPNAEQEAVIEFIGGRALVLAAPGCGKTEILSHRIRKAHTDFGVEFGQMLCLTFTNRAAREMRRRVVQTLCEEDISGLFIGNLHRFCISLLFKNQLITIDTSIIDDADQAEIIQELAADMMLGSLKNWEINAVIGDACTLREKNGKIPFRAHSDRGSFAQSEELAQKYVAFLRAHHMIDYDDILYYAYLALSTPKIVKQLDTKPFQWIQVDEVQDLNPLQLAIVDLLASPDATVVYLGDERQSIYSFMGAKRESLLRVMDECRDHIFYLNRNYRAPKYLLSMLNDYAQTLLGMRPQDLPRTSNDAEEANALLTVECTDVYDQLNTVAKMVGGLQKSFPKEHIGVLVRSNMEVNKVSEALSRRKIRHLAISNHDIFKSLSFKTIYSHLSVILLDTSFIDGARILFQTKIFPRYSVGRAFMMRMRALGMTPGDLLDYDNSTYVLEFAKAFGNKEIVVFDTETTGTDTYSDDIIQIAACRMRGGEVVPGSELDIMIRTDKAIPPTLKDNLPNPMVEEYARRAAIPNGQPGALLEPREAFEIFRDYVVECDVVGHNVKFDIDILYRNLSRRAPEIYIPEPRCWDTLALARRLDPNLRKYNLESLIARYDLEGQNSHNASDDVFATAQLAKVLNTKALSVREAQLNALSSEVMEATRRTLRANYGELYNHTRLLMDGHNVTLTREIEFIHDYLAQKGHIQRLEGLKYMISLFEELLIDKEKEPYFAQQLTNHLHELRTFNEADLYENNILDRNVHVMTIHKAKGLQFDNVVLVGVNKDSFPGVKTTKPEEDARLLYVALSRARRRLHLSFVKEISTFISGHPAIEKHFTKVNLTDRNRVLGL